EQPGRVSGTDDSHHGLAEPRARARPVALGPGGAAGGAVPDSGAHSLARRARSAAPGRSAATLQTVKDPGEYTQRGQHSFRRRERTEIAASPRLSASEYNYIFIIIIDL